MNKQLLKSKMVLCGDRITDLAEVLGISYQSVSRKMNEVGGSEFLQSEIRQIALRYHLSNEDIIAIFFSP